MYILQRRGEEQTRAVGLNKQAVLSVLRDFEDTEMRDHEERRKDRPHNAPALSCAPASTYWLNSSRSSGIVRWRRSVHLLLSIHLTSKPPEHIALPFAFVLTFFLSFWLAYIHSYGISLLYGERSEGHKGFYRHTDNGPLLIYKYTIPEEYFSLTYYYIFYGGYIHSRTFLLDWPSTLSGRTRNRHDYRNRYIQERSKSSRDKGKSVCRHREYEDDDQPFTFHSVLWDDLRLAHDFLLIHILIYETILRRNFWERIRCSWTGFILFICFNFMFYCMESNVL